MTLCLLAAASLVTVIQRIVTVHRQSLAEPEGTATEPEAAWAAPNPGRDSTAVTRILPAPAGD